ncbi:MAG: HAD hydrolase-like protein, partial [Gemmatimonadota bacterium]|nr:HAD hydrolase-like protein [Gemmatimonadota bacterium]
ARAAFKEARAHFQTDFLPGNTFVIGDTQKDIEAGRAIGARTVAVATGPVSAEDLASAGPDLLVDNFASGAETVRQFFSG